MAGVGMLKQELFNMRRANFPVEQKQQRRLAPSRLYANNVAKHRDSSNKIVETQRMWGAHEGMKRLLALEDEKKKRREERRKRRRERHRRSGSDGSSGSESDGSRPEKRAKAEEGSDSQSKEKVEEDDPDANKDVASPSKGPPKDKKRLVVVKKEVKSRRSHSPGRRSRDRGRRRDRRSRRDSHGRSRSRDRRGRSRSHRRQRSRSASSSPDTDERMLREQERVRRRTERDRVKQKRKEDSIRKKLEEAGIDDMAVDGAAEAILNKWVQDGYQDRNEKRMRDGKLVSREDDRKLQLEERKAARAAMAKGQGQQQDWDKWLDTSLEESKRLRAEENRRRKKIGLPSLEELEEQQAARRRGLLKEQDEEEFGQQEAVKWKTRELSVMYKKRDSKGKLARAGAFRPPGHTDSEASLSDTEEEEVQPAKQPSASGQLCSAFCTTHRTIPIPPNLTLTTAYVNFRNTYTHSHLNR